MISNEPSCDKENVNSFNIASNYTLTKKIEKNSTKDKFRRTKRAHAIRKLTQHLKRPLEHKSTPQSRVCGIFSLTNSNPTSMKEFICYDDREVVGDDDNMRYLIQKRIVDNDVESDEEQVEACVAYVQGQLMEAKVPQMN